MPSKLANQKPRFCNYLKQYSNVRNGERYLYISYFNKTFNTTLCKILPAVLILKVAINMNVFNPQKFL